MGEELIARIIEVGKCDNFKDGCNRKVILIKRLENW
jgi:hypothetical protein